MAWSGATAIAIDGYDGFMEWSAAKPQWTLGSSSFLYTHGSAAAIWDGKRFVTLDRSGSVNISQGDATTFAFYPAAKSAPSSLRALAWSGSVYVAVGDGGRVATSPDAVTWTLGASGTTDSLVAVVWAGSEFVALGSAGTILTSPDGVTWTVQRAAVAGRTFAGMIWSGSRFVIVGTGTQASPDGKTWTDGSAAGGLTAVAWSQPLGRFAATGAGQILTSTDGAIWTPHPLPTIAATASIAWAGDRFVAVAADGFILSSRDGDHWIVESLAISIKKVVWLGDRFLAVGADGTYLTSPDGLSWTVATTGTSQILYSVAVSPSAYAFGTANNLVSAPDLMKWTTHFLGSATLCDGLVWTGTTCLAVCSDGAYQAAADCTNWSGGLVTTAADEWSDVVWNGSLFVAVGNVGKIATSTDGMTWTARDSGTTQPLSSIIWTGQQFLAVGQGVATLSPDGTTWTSSSIMGTPQLNGVAWAGTRFLAVGNQALVLESADGLTWSYTAATIPTNSLLGENLNSIAFSGTRSVVIGDSGIILVVDR